MKTSKYTELQKKVVDKANELCSKYPWYSGGVCVNHLPKDYEIKKGFDEVINLTFSLPLKLKT